VVKQLANPIFLRAAIVLIASAVSFLLGVIFIRALRKNIAQEADFSDTKVSSLEALPLNLYNTVIQELKQQKHELQVQSQAEQQRARISDNFSQAVLANLSSGVLVFGANGLVKTANPTAKAILGFASAVGMSAEDIFRDTASSSNEDALVCDEIHAVLREGSKKRHSQAQYITPSGDKKFLSATVSQIPAVDGSMLGVACLINDLSEIENIRQQQQMHGEISAEMALDLRTSLATISGYAQELSNNKDPEMTRRLAADIAEQAAQLDRNIGGFLAPKPAQHSTGAVASK
jgi:PAS domain S-box-containing protein